MHFNLYFNQKCFFKIFLFFVTSSFLCVKRSIMGYCRNSSKLLLFMVPLILVFGYIAFVGTKNCTNNGVVNSCSSIISSFSGAHKLIPLESSQVFRNREAKTDDDQVVEEQVSDTFDLRANIEGENEREEAVLVDYTFNSSASPPLAAVQPVYLQPSPSPDGEEELFWNITSTNGTQLLPPVNDSNVPLIGGIIQRKYTSLDRLESGLRQVRAVIKMAKTGNRTNDPDYIPTGPMYRNAAAFHRSYLEMEKSFKVYVYEEGEFPVFHNGPCKSIYSTEGTFIYAMENSRFRTRDPEKAHAFFLPISVALMVRFIYDREHRNSKPIKQTLVDYVNVISQKYPYWNRSAGADHFMLACHDWGPETSTAVPDLYKNSIRALCNANTSEGFKPTKDVSIPEINLITGTLDGFLGGPSPSKRSILAFFAGGVHGPIRPILLEHWENKDQDVQVHKYLPKGVSYYEMLRKSRFCICPSGYEVASPRMVEALYTGCVPVIVKDHYVAPFSDVLKWKTFSVDIAVKDIPNLKNILMGISTRDYIRMQRRGKQVRRHFENDPTTKRYDVIHMILHSVWLRRLNIRVQGASDS